MRKVFLLILILIVFYAQIASSQSQSSIQRPEVGKQMPDFTLNNVTHFNKTSASLIDFKGKWLFLDFWFPGCPSCIKSFSKIDKFQKHFKERVQFILIGVNDRKYKGIEDLYERIRAKQNLRLASAYDSILDKRWDIWSMPHIIVIDPKGTVRVITTGYDMTVEKIEDLLQGKEVFFHPKDIDSPAFNPDLLSPSSISYSNNHLIYRSVLTKWNGEQVSIPNINLFAEYDSEYLKKGYNAVMIPLYALYNQAYIGQMGIGTSDTLLYGFFYPKPILELKDSSLFQWNALTGVGCYNYHMLVPIDKVNRDYLMSVLQKELKNVFGYEVFIENREVSVWKLMANPSAKNKLRTKGGIPNFDGGPAGTGATGFTMVNFPIRKLIAVLKRYVNSKDIPLIVDETGIIGNIDIKVDADLTNLLDIKKVLHENGLDLIKGKRNMKAIIIRDGYFK